MKKNIIVLVILIAIVALWYRFSHKDIVSNGGTSKPLATATYMCDAGKTITASFYESTGGASATPITTTVANEPPHPTGSAHIDLSDERSLDLPATLSASGVRYANADESFVFWTKGNTAFVVENGQDTTYQGCISVAPIETSLGLPAVYANSTEGFSLRLPSLSTSTTSEGSDSYRVDEKYTYQAFGPNKSIAGVTFTIPSSIKEGTNLSSDSYISVEHIPNVQMCNANLFLPDVQGVAETVTQNTTTYSVASSTGAAAGNRYEETVYAIPGTNPCTAVRYFIHYGVLENYPAGTVRAFDKTALLKEFDSIRQTLTLAQ